MQHALFGIFLSHLGNSETPHLIPHVVVINLATNDDSIGMHALLFYGSIKDGLEKVRFFETIFVV